MSIEKQIQRIFKRPLNLADFEINNLYLVDVKDGNIYQKFLATNDGKGVINRKTKSFVSNTDGVQLSTHSDTSLWPYYLANNEIDIKKRFSLENVIIAGKKSAYLIFRKKFN